MFVALKAINDLKYRETMGKWKIKKKMFFWSNQKVNVIDINFVVVIFSKLIKKTVN